MATKVPKKKWQFFGQTISDLSAASYDSRSNSPRSPSYETPPSGESTRHSSPFQMLSPHSPTPSLDYPASSQPIYAPTPIHPQDYPNPVLATVGGHYQPVLPEPPPPPYGRGAYAARFAPPDAHSREGGPVGAENGEVAAPSSCYSPLEDDGETEPARVVQGQGGYPSHSKGSGTGGSKATVVAAGGSGGGGRCQKRPQRCRMCANHGILVDMKGHKWYCPFRECPCGDCEITRKTQYYMKERQKLTRHQQQQLNEEKCGSEGAGGGAQGSLGGSDTSGRRRSTGPGGFDQNQMDFPRVEEMVSQTKNILDYDLFEKVNQACRPRSSAHLHN